MPLDSWRVLGVKQGATKDEIRAAYLNLAKTLHPDVNDSSAATEMMRLVNLAYDDLMGQVPSREPYRNYAYRSPQPPPQQARYDDPCEMPMPLGKFKGTKLVDLWRRDPHYVNWCINEFKSDSLVRTKLLDMLRHQGGGIW